MHAILIHGMGRTPLAMSILAARLRISGIRPHLFGYSVTFERWDKCIQRLEHFITGRVKTDEYFMIGHSLGSILTRAVLPGLIHPPVACFFLGSPTRVCKAANNFAHYRLAKLLIVKSGSDLRTNNLWNRSLSRASPLKSTPGRADRADGTRLLAKSSTMAC